MRNKWICAIFVILGFFSSEVSPLFANKAEIAEVRFGYNRPYSFYYPYNYQFYSDPRNYGNSNACHWLYTNGTYVYNCG